MRYRDRDPRDIIEVKFLTFRMEYFWWLLIFANVFFVGAPRSDRVNCMVILSTFFNVFHSDWHSLGAFCV